MKIIRLKNGIPYTFPFNFRAKGIGVLYNNFTTWLHKSGSSAGDMFDLQFGSGKEYIIVQGSLTAFDRQNKIVRPYGYEYPYPILLKKGEKLTFATRASGIGEDDVNLLLYGVPVVNDSEFNNLVQKKPNRFIKIRFFQFPSTGVSLEMPFENKVNVLGIGLLYAYHASSTPEFTDLPDTVKGYFMIMNKLYYPFDDQSRAINLISDIYNGRIARMKYFNVKRLVIEPNDLLTLTLSTALASTQNLYVVVEYYE